MKDKENIRFNTVEEAVSDLKQGKIIVVTDDPERENEGDLICAARYAGTANVNFMATYGKGLICMPMSREMTVRLGLGPMVRENTDNHCTAFTVSIDHISTGTGISATERSVTAMKCADPDSKPEDFRRPGHMFPLEARPGGVMERFRYHSLPEHKVNTHVKSIVDPKRVCTMTGCHEAARISGLSADSHGNPLKKGFRDRIPQQDVIRINHYAVKSYEEFLEKQLRGRASGTQKTVKPEYFTQYDLNDIEDA